MCESYAYVHRYMPLVLKNSFTAGNLVDIKLNLALVVPMKSDAFLDFGGHIHVYSQKIEWFYSHEEL